MKQKRGWAGRAAGIVVAAAVVTGGASFAPRLRARVDDQVQNLLYRVRGSRHGDPRIVLAAIDDESLASVGAFPWRRAVWAKVIDRLTGLGARAIALDVMFLDPSAHPADDKALAEATKRSGRVVHAAFFAPARGGKPEEREDPLPDIVRGAAGVGNVSVSDDLEPDGTIRDVTIAQPSEGHPDVLSLAVVAVARYRNTDPKTLAATLPAWIRLDYPGPSVAGSYRSVSLSHVLNGGLTPDETRALHDSLVYVGSLSSRAFDLYPSPFGGQMPGVMTRLTEADNILNRGWLRGLSPAPEFLVCAVPIAALLAWLSTLSAAAFTAGAACVALACLVAAWLAFLAGLWLSPLTVAAVYLTGVLGSVAARAVEPRGR